MDQPIRPKSSNAHKPRIRIQLPTVWPVYQIVPPVFVLQRSPYRIEVVARAGKTVMAERYSLASAIDAAVELTKDARGNPRDEPFYVNR